jgi:hypothetical protein
MDITSNGVYRAINHNVDGFYEVNVKVSSAQQEAPTVDLSMPLGDQLITPSVQGRVLSHVVVTKPTTLIPENIMKGVNIGGVVGTHEDNLTEQIIYRDGDYTPPTGYSGFSKVTVKVGKSSFDKMLRVGEFFTHAYDVRAEVIIDQWGVVRYENTGESIIFTASDMGSCFATVNNIDANGDITSTTYYAIVVSDVGDSTLPVTASTVAEMEAFLARGVAGSVIKYIGVNDGGFVQGALYIVEEVK